MSKIVNLLYFFCYFKVGMFLFHKNELTGTSLKLLAIILGLTSLIYFLKFIKQASKESTK